MLSECTYDKKDFADTAEYVKTQFFRMLGIFPDQFLRIEEHSCRGFEVDPMFLKVDPVFFFVPLKGDRAGSISKSSYSIPIPRQ